MAAAMLSEEQVQRSMPTSEDDAEYEEDYDQDVDMGANAEAFAANNQLLNGVSQVRTEGDDYDEHGEDNNEEEDEDHGQEDEEDDLSDRDAEGEDDYEHGLDDTIRVSFGGNGALDEGEDDDDDGEGVGAVKIQPRESDDDDDDDAASVQDDDEESDDEADGASKDSSDESEVEAEAEWEATAAQQDDEADPVDPNRCIFCQQDEEHDPSPEFEEYLSCAVCGDNAHRQCARDANALDQDEDGATWRCPSCVSNALEPDAMNQDSPTVIGLRRSSAPKLARDLLPSQRGAIKPDSHSVFNHLIVDDDPMDGSRLLRKRKTSSAEAEESVMASIGKRRKRISDGSSNAILTDAEAAEIIESKQTELGGEADRNNAPEPTPSRPLRSLRPQKVPEPPAVIEKHSRTSLIVRLRLNLTELARILSRPPKPIKKRSRSRAVARTASISAPPPAYVPRIYSQPFYSFHDKDTDELKSKPYGGILTEAESETTKTLPQADDRRMFDNARQKAEEEWALKTALAQAEAETVKKPRKVSGPASQIECINFGGYEIDTWYAAPYPEEYSRNRVLYICEFCLKYMNSEYVAWRHKMKCSTKHPPGDEIYRDGSVSVFEVDGRKNPVYCQNLCLLAKLFLGSKTLYYDVEPFLFYVMTEYDEYGCHFVGYFSKEKRPSSQNNVSCILTLPIHQRKGYGNLLIDFSYLLTLVERKSGSPEKPLSDMGLVSYRNYWRLVLCYKLLPSREEKRPLSVLELSEQTGMTADDIVSALEGLRALVRDPVTGTYALRLDYDFYEEYIKKWEDKNYVRLNPHGLVWTPYVMGRNNQNMVDHAAPMNTIAPREDGDDQLPPDAAPPALTNGEGPSAFLASPVTEAQSTHQGDEMALDSFVVESAGKNPRPSTDTNPTLASPPSSRPSLQPLTNGTPHPNYSLTINTDTPLSIIPPSRFEVYPPINASRSRAPRLSLSGPSGSTPRSARPSASRSAARRTGGSRARSSGSSRRTSRARRSTGGTGRGPGRWPKGTKKSDFGNADSGPGLPPRLLKERSRLGVEVRLGGEVEEEKEEEGSESDEGILYETPGMSRRRNGAVAGKGKGKMVLSDDEDLVIGDVDVDAEGEDE